MLSGAQAVRFLPEGERKWDGPFTFEVNVRNMQTKELHENVTFTSSDEIPYTYLLENTEGFPSLNLANKNSRFSFVERLKVYVNQLRITEPTYIYQAFLDIGGIEDLLTPPQYTSLNCALDSFAIHPDYNLGTLELSSVLVKAGTDAFQHLDITSKIRKLFGSVSLKTEELSNFNEIICTPSSSQGAIYYSVGSMYECEKPQIPGINGFEEPASKKKTFSFVKGDNIYEDSIASCIISPYPQSYLTEIEEDYDEQISFADTQSISRMSTFPDEEPSLDLYQHFSLIGYEERASSPYIYYDGKQAFLTQTFEQNCLPLTNEEFEETPPHRLRYTLPTAYPVSIPGFKQTARAPGVYHLDDGYWMQVKDSYEPKHRFKAEKRTTPEGIFTETLRSQATHNYDLVTTFKQSEPLHEYFEFERESKFQELLDKFQDKFQHELGLRKTVEALTLQEQHLITPLLVILRDREDIEDPDLMIDHNSKDACTKISSCGISPVWSCIYQRRQTSKSLFHCLRENRRWTIGTPSSLRLLPLISSSYPSNFLHFDLVSYDYINKKPIPSSTWKEAYYNIAQFFSFDAFEVFNISPISEEPDIELNVQPLARVIRNHEKLKCFNITFHTGIKNVEYLIDHGLSQNHSIEKLTYCFYGDYPIALMGRLLAKNKFLKRVSLDARSLADCECLNELARGLAQNTVLEGLSLGICFSLEKKESLNSYPDWVLHRSHRDRQAQRPLPGRPRGSQTHDFSIFKQAVLKSNLKTIRVAIDKGGPATDSFLRMIREVDKPGLKIQTITRWHR